MKVEGKIPTKYGTMRFVMKDAKGATLLALWKIHGVEYNASLYVMQAENADDGWKEKAGNTYIRRVDKKDINYRSSTYNNIRETMLGEWASYVAKPDKCGVLFLAALVNKLNEQAEYEAIVTDAEKLLQIANKTLSQWKAANSDLMGALRMGVEQTEKYDKNNVAILYDEG